MNRKIQIVLAAAFLAMACKEKPATPAPAPAAAPAVEENKIQSGIYMGPGKGACLCVNVEKGMAALSNTLASMGTDLGTQVAGRSDDMKAALKENFSRLKFVSKDQIVDSDGGAKYTRVQKANDCELLNTSAAAPVGYQDYCLEGKVVAKEKEF